MTNQNSPFYSSNQIADRFHHQLRKCSFYDFCAGLAQRPHRRNFWRLRRVWRLGICHGSGLNLNRLVRELERMDRVQEVRTDSHTGWSYFVSLSCPNQNRRLLKKRLNIGEIRKTVGTPNKNRLRSNPSSLTGRKTSFNENKWYNSACQECPIA